MLLPSSFNEKKLGEETHTTISKVRSTATCQKQDLNCLVFFKEMKQICSKIFMLKDKCTEIGKNISYAA